MDTAIKERMTRLRAANMRADVCMLASSLLKHGVDYVGELTCGLRNWLDVNGYDSVEQLKGSISYGNCPDFGHWSRLTI